MIVVTGGAGFIGSNIIKGLNARGYSEILVVDDLTDGTKFKNLVDCKIMDYLDKDDFIQRLYHDNLYNEIKIIFHQGACSSTTEWNGKFILTNNYEYTKILFHFCQKKSIPFIYASSAAVYGKNRECKEIVELEAPLNLYGYSKLLFDRYLRRHFAQLTSQVVGLRYFNVYGPRESHKGVMASIAFHLNNQIMERSIVQLFQGCDGYSDGEQRRDFIYVDDVVEVNLWFMDHSNISGIFNVGTGCSQSFNDVAKAVIAWHKKGAIQYIPFPDHLKGRYQSFTQADISALRKIGCKVAFKTVDLGVKLYLDWLNQAIGEDENKATNVAVQKTH